MIQQTENLFFLNLKSFMESFEEVYIKGILTCYRFLNLNFFKFVSYQKIPFLNIKQYLFFQKLPSAHTQQTKYLSRETVPSEKYITLA